MEGPRRISSLRVIMKNSDILVVQTFLCSPAHSMGEGELGPRAPRKHHCTQSLALLLQFPGSLCVMLVPLRIFPAADDPWARQSCPSALHSARIPS